MGHVVVLLRDGDGTKGVGLDQVGTGGQVAFVDVADDVRTGERQQLVVALHVARKVLEPLAAVLRFGQLEALDHGAHGPVQDGDTLGQDGRQLLGAGVGGGLHGGIVENHRCAAPHRGFQINLQKTKNDMV